MKTCPTCNKDYTEDELFCLNDGGELVENKSAAAVAAEPAAPAADANLFLSQPQAPAGQAVGTLYLNGQELVLSEGAGYVVIRIGSDRPAAAPAHAQLIEIDDGSVSSKGVLIEVAGGEILVTDYGAGTTIVGDIIPLNAAKPVHMGGAVMCGNQIAVIG